MRMRRGIGVLALLLAAPAVLRADMIDLGALPHAIRDEVIETPGIVYASLPGFRALELTLYQPASRTAWLPIVLVLHGDGWLSNPARPIAGTPPQPEQSAAGMAATLLQLARRGYVVAEVGYRLSAEARFPAQIQDVKRAVRFLRAHAADIGGDPQHVMVWGASAGGYLAVLLGASCGVAPLEPPVADSALSDCVDGVVDWYGPVVFSRLDAELASNQRLPAPLGGAAHAAASSAESQLLGCALPACPADLLTRANPISYLSSKSPPFLIMHGMGDTEVPYQQSVDLADALKSAGVRATLTLVPNAGHRFVGIPGTLVDKLVDQTFAFFDLVSGR
jgi:acetyl esterase/lipase